MNLFNAVSGQLKVIRANQPADDKLYIKSFSDCIYLESTDPLSLLFSIHSIFNVVLGYNSNLDQEREYTPLLRAGIVKDWVLRFMDIGSLARQSSEHFYQNDEFNNPVGLGVARAYLTSEESDIAGMRIIISPEVIEALTLNKFEKVDFECYYVECPNLLRHSDLPKTQVPVKLFILPINTDQHGRPTKLYELCWPVYSYNWSRNDSDLPTMVEELFKMESHFSGGNLKHLNRTAELLVKALKITNELFDQKFKEDEFLRVITELEQLQNKTVYEN